MLLRLAALLLLGFGTALLVAWLPATFVTRTRQTNGASQALQPRWDVGVRRGFGRTVVDFEQKYMNWLQAPRPDATESELDHWVAQRRALKRNEPPAAYHEPAKHVIATPYWSRASSVPTLADRDIRFIDTAQGWPLRCVLGHWRESTSGSGTYIGQWILQIPIAQSAAVLVGLPFRPIWIGIVANTLFNVLLICLVVACGRTCRSWIRRRRGLCYLCGYPVGGSLRCTECGACHLPERAA